MGLDGREGPAGPPDSTYATPLAISHTARTMAGMGTGQRGGREEGLLRS